MTRLVRPEELLAYGPGTASPSDIPPGGDIIAPPRSEQIGARSGPWKDPDPLLRLFYLRLPQSWPETALRSPPLGAYPSSDLPNSLRPSEDGDAPNF